MQAELGGPASEAAAASTSVDMYNMESDGSY